MGWAGHVAYMGDRRGAYKVLMGGDLRERYHLKDSGIDGRILQWIFIKMDGGHGLD
jgi:hypothetical protein